jgi:hypothetical protein
LIMFNTLFVRVLNDVDGFFNSDVKKCPLLQCSMVLNCTQFSYHD